MKKLILFLFLTCFISKELLSILPIFSETTFKNNTTEDMLIKINREKNDKMPSIFKIEANQAQIFKTKKLNKAYKITIETQKTKYRFSLKKLKPFKKGTYEISFTDEGIERRQIYTPKGDFFKKVNYLNIHTPDKLIFLIPPKALPATPTSIARKKFGMDFYNPRDKTKPPMPATIPY
ncbi:hypothetical protein K9M16_02025 [Candidatus Babeliales bacterium]|nr:hypothetical protein [Candidatus Babeliales bacterium]